MTGPIVCRLASAAYLSPLGGTKKSGRCRDGNHTLSYAEKISSVAKTIKTKQGVAKAKRGYRGGYKFSFYFEKPNVYAVSRPSLERFHTTIRQFKGL